MKFILKKHMNEYETSLVSVHALPPYSLPRLVGTSSLTTLVSVFRRQGFVPSTSARRCMSDNETLNT